VQDATVRAMERWPDQGVPADVEGWLLIVAHNLVMDATRRDRRLTAWRPEHEGRTEAPALEIDDELRLVFLCCHPVLPRAAQVALTLRIAFGLSVPQIARAFLSDERTLSQRLVRAKQRLREERVTFELPAPTELSARLDPVLDVLYLVFSEGYSPTEGEATVDDTLCGESLRLARLLAATPRTATPAVEALCALFCFQASRARARRADDGSLLLLAEQDRTRWDAELLAGGFAHLDRAARGDALSRFHVEAGIAACHAAAPSYAATDWPAIAGLYDTLRALSPSPVVEVNRALAVAMCEGALAGLDELDAIPERELCARYPYALAAYAELHASLGHLDEARAYLDRALEHQPSPPQRALLKRKRAALAR
jgi:RNA polymerase sigma-70 factor (ECF subfamily)